MNNNPWKGMASYTEADVKIFKGRDEDCEKLFSLVENSRLSVLLAVSGIGKSSLINAGLVPKLRAKDYAILNVRFNQDFWNEVNDNRKYKTIEDVRAKFDEWVVAQIANEVEAEVWNIKELNACLWGLSHSPYEKSLGRNRSKKCVFIFDQFEEIFDRAGSDTVINGIFAELAELYNNVVPDRYGIKEDNVDENGVCRFQEDCKMLFSLRKEYSAEFDYWTNERYGMRQLLLSRMILLPFTEGQAEEIVEFQYEGDKRIKVLDKVSVEIISQCKNELNEYSENKDRKNCVEPFLLSIICQSLFNLAQEKGAEYIELSDVGRIASTIADFYENTVKECKISGKHIKIIEDVLVDDYGKRNRIRPSSSRRFRKIDFEHNYLEKLSEKHLVRFQDGYVELVHDKIAAHIFEKRQKINSKSWNKLVTGYMIMLLAVLGLGYFFSFQYSNDTASSISIVNRDPIVECEVGKDEEKRGLDGYGKIVVEKMTINFDSVDGSFSYDKLSGFPRLKELIVESKQWKLRNIYVSNCPSLKKITFTKRGSADACYKSVNIADCPSLDAIDLECPFGKLCIEKCPSLDKIKLPNRLKDISIDVDDNSKEFIAPDKLDGDVFVSDGVVWSGNDIVYANKYTSNYINFPKGVYSDSIKYKYKDKERVFYNSKNIKDSVKWDSTDEANHLFLTKPQSVVVEKIYTGKKIIIHNKQYLEGVVLRKGLIFPETFVGCENLKTVVLEDYCEVSSCAFVDCKKLDSVIISPSCRLDKMPFYACGNINFKLQKDSMDYTKYSMHYGCIFEEANFVQPGTEPLDFKNDTVRFESKSYYTDGDGRLYSNPIYALEYMPYSLCKRFNSKDDVSYIDCTIYSAHNVSPSAYPANIRELHINSPNMTDLNIPNSVKENIILYVPYGSLDYYQNSDGFKAFKDIKEDSIWMRIYDIIAYTIVAMFSYWYHYSVWILLAAIIVLVFLMIKYKKTKLVRWAWWRILLILTLAYLIYWNIFMWMPFSRWNQWICVAEAVAAIIVAILIVYLLYSKMLTLDEAKEYGKLICKKMRASLSAIICKCKVGLSAIRKYFSKNGVWKVLFILSVLFVGYGCYYVFSFRGRVEKLVAEGNYEEAIDLLPSSTRFLTNGMKKNLDEIVDSIYSKINGSSENIPLKIDYSLVNKEKGHSDVVRKMVFSDDGSRLASISYDGQCIVWNINTCDTVFTAYSEDGYIDMDFSGDGSKLLLGSCEDSRSTVLMYDINSRTRRETSFEGYLKQIKLSADNSCAYIRSCHFTGEFRIWNFTGDAYEKYVKIGCRSSFSVSPDNKLIAFADTSNVKIYHVNDFKERQSINTPNNKYVDDLKFLSNDKLMLEADDTIKLLDLVNGNIRNMDFGNDIDLCNVSVISEDELLYRKYEGIQRYNLKKGNNGQEICVKGDIASYAYTKVQKIARGDFYGNILLYDIKGNFENILYADFGGNVRELISKGNIILFKTPNQLVSVNMDSGKICNKECYYGDFNRNNNVFYKENDGRTKVFYISAARYDSVCIYGRYHNIFVGKNDNIYTYRNDTIRVWNKSGVLKKWLYIPDEIFMVSNTGSYLITKPSSDSEGFYLWNMENFKKTRIDNTFSKGAFMRNDEGFVLLDYRKAYKFDMNCQKTDSIYFDQGLDNIVIRDKRYVISRDSNGFRLYSLKTGKLIQEFKHRKCYDIEMSSDGRYIYSIGTGHIRRWDWSLEWKIRYLKNYTKPSLKKVE